MRKVLKIVLLYSIGILCVLSLAWRVSNLDSVTNNKSLVDNYNNKECL